MADPLRSTVHRPQTGREPQNIPHLLPVVLHFFNIGQKNLQDFDDEYGHIHPTPWAW